MSQSILTLVTSDTYARVISRRLLHGWNTLSSLLEEMIGEEGRRLLALILDSYRKYKKMDHV